MALTTAAILIGGSALIGAAGSIKAGRDQQKAAEYNARVKEADATAAEQKAEYDANMHRDRVKSLLSKQRAMSGASGLQLTGSHADALLDTVEKGEMDALAIRYGGDIQAARNRSEATSYRMQGKSARTQSYFNAGSSLLSGGSKIARMYS